MSAAEAVCGGHAGMKIAIRMDDITPDMNWDNFLALKALFDKYHICPLIGVVPDNRDVVCGLWSRVRISGNI